jgi:hypothetical protein
MVVNGYAITCSTEPNDSKLKSVNSPTEEVVLTFWDLEETDKAVFSFRPPIAHLKSATISSDLSMLALNAKDLQGRELILVYSF